MPKVIAFVLLVFLSASFTCTPVDAFSAGGPKLKSLFQKKGKSKGVFKKRKQNKKYYHAAAKKQRKAKWQRNTMVQR